MKIYLYSAISQESANRLSPIFATASGRAKAALARLRDMLAWRLLGQFKCRQYNYAEHPNSNAGDIAIRHALRQELATAFSPAPVDFVELAWGDLTAEWVDRMNADGDLFVIGGSGYYQHDVKGVLNRQPAADVEHLRRMRCPIAAIGIGVNCVLQNHDTKVGGFDARSEAIVRESLGLLSLCMVRDVRSLELLQSLSVKPVVLAGDSALFLDAAPRTPRESSDHPGPVIGLNFPFHGPFSESMLAKNLPIYAGALKTLRDKTGCRFVYFQHSDAEAVIPKLLGWSGVAVETVSGDPRETLLRYASLTVHFCGMLHSAILSTNAGTPCVNVAYDIKNRGFLQLLGTERFLLDPGRLTEDAIVKAVVTMIAERDAVARQIRARKAELRATFTATLRTFAEPLLEATSPSGSRRG